MPCTERRCQRRAGRRETIRKTTVVTNPADCCILPETIAEEVYDGIKPSILIENCCDSRINGCAEYDTSMRCPYWPKFAHPRWLSCDELHNRKTT